MQRLRRYGLLLVSALMIGASLLYAFQERIIFLPSTLEQNYQYSFNEPFEEIFLEHPDGAKLNALHFKREFPKGLILYFHGNAGDLSRWGEITTYFVEKNFDVIVMDYRTYGKSTGEMSESKLFEDAELYYRYALKHSSEDNIIIYGRSLGAAIATQLASQQNPGKLILETPFYNLYDVASGRIPLLPVKHLLRYKFESNLYIKDVKCPIVIFHGTDDSVVPYESGQKLFDAIKGQQKRFYTIEHGDHNNLVEFEAYQKGIAVELNQTN